MRRWSFGGGIWSGEDLDRRGCYGLVTNNSDVARLASTHAKAIAYLARVKKQLSIALTSDVAMDGFRFRLVFRDWLSIAPGRILVDQGDAIPPEILEQFSVPG